MVDFYVGRKIENEVELGAVNKNKVMNAGIGWWDYPDQSWTLNANLLSNRREKDVQETHLLAFRYR